MIRHWHRSFLAAAALSLAGCVVEAPDEPTCGPDGKDCPEVSALAGTVSPTQLPAETQYADTKVATVLGASAGPGLTYADGKLGLAKTGCGEGGVVVWTGTAWSCAAKISAAQLPFTNAVLTDPTLETGGKQLSPAELAHLDGVTGPLQAQLDARQATLTGAASSVATADLAVSRAVVSDASGKLAAHAEIDVTELGALEGIDSNVQAQLDGVLDQLEAVDGLVGGKQATITGAASTVVSANLTGSRVVATDAAGKLVAGTVTATELGHLGGATSNLQAQLNELRDDVRRLAGWRMTAHAMGGTDLVAAGFPAALVNFSNYPTQVVNAAEGVYVKYLQQNSNTGGIRSNFDVVRRSMAPDFTANIRSEGNPFGVPKANWVGLTNAATLGLANVPAGTEFIGFRWVGSLDAGKWACVTSDGVATTVVATPVVVGTEIPHQLRISVSGDGSAARFYIGGTLRCTITTTLPGLETGLGLWVSTSNGGGNGWTNIAVSRLLLVHK